MKIFAAAYAFFVGVGILKPLIPFSRLSYQELHVPYWQHNVDYDIFNHTLTVEDMFYLLLIIFGGFFLITGLIIFFKKIYPYKKDRRLGFKKVVRYKINNKLYFPNTNEFFFSLNDPKYLHHEVEESEYYSKNIGDEVKVFRGIYSGYVFEKDGRFTFM